MFLKKNISKGKIDNIARQITEAISPFTSPDEPGNRIRIHEIIVMTPRNITEDAKDYIQQHCGTNFPSLHWVDGVNLVSLINKVISAYNEKTKGQYIFSVETFINICEYAIQIDKVIHQEGTATQRFL